MGAADPPLLTTIEEFGRIDAESELQLANFFIKTDAYRRVQNVEHIVVLGRKGTGKTAIYRALMQAAERFRNTQAVGLQFRNYPWQAHAEFEDATVTGAERYVESWQFLILVELAKLALRATRTIPRTDAAQKATTGVYRFIRNNWGQVRFDFKETFRKRNYSLEIEPRAVASAIASTSRLVSIAPASGEAARGTPFPSDWAAVAPFAS